MRPSTIRKLKRPSIARHLNSTRTHSRAMRRFRSDATLRPSSPLNTSHPNAAELIVTPPSHNISQIKPYRNYHQSEKLFQTIHYSEASVEDSPVQRSNRIFAQSLHDHESRTRDDDFSQVKHDAASAMEHAIKSLKYRHATEMGALLLQQVCACYHSIHTQIIGLYFVVLHFTSLNGCRIYSHMLPHMQPVL